MLVLIVPYATSGVGERRLCVSKGWLEERGGKRAEGGGEQRGLPFGFVGGFGRQTVPSQRTAGLSDDRIQRLIR